MASDLHYALGGRSPLQGIDLDAPPGSTTHIVGSSIDSNALLGLLVGLYPAERGSVTLDGTDLTDLPLTTARSSVALVLQDPWIMNGTIADNIAFGDPGVDRDRIETIARLACVDEMAVRLPDGLDTMTGDTGTELSIGQKRLVALARALLRNPAVLLLEDPFRDLTAREETSAIKAINRAGSDRTTIITTPRFDPSMFSTDQVYRLADGRLHPAAPDDAEVTGAAPTNGSGHATTTGSDRASARPVEVGTEIGLGYTAAGLLHRWERTETWLAWHADTSTIAEVKVPRVAPTTKAARNELAAEFERARRLAHPGLSRPIAAQLSGERPLAAYERIEGHLLSHLIGPSRSGAALSNDGRPLGLDLDPVAIGADLARTLAHLHRLGFAHLDLGPHVVKPSPHGAVITDLKHSVPIGSQQLRFYEPDERAARSPEQLRGDPASAAMDVYALGSLMQRLLADTEHEPQIVELVAAMGATCPDDRPAASDALSTLRSVLLPVSPRPGGSRDPSEGAEDAALVGSATDHGSP